MSRATLQQWVSNMADDIANMATGIALVRSASTLTIARIPECSTNHSRAGLDEPVEPKLRGLSHGGPKLIVDVLLVKAQLVQHADQVPVLLLCVVLALVRAVGDPQLVERGLVARHLYENENTRIVVQLISRYIDQDKNKKPIYHLSPYLFITRGPAFKPLTRPEPLVGHAKQTNKVLRGC